MGGTRPLLALLATPLLCLAVVPTPPAPPSPPINYASSSSDVVFSATETTTNVPTNITFNGQVVLGSSTNYSTAAYAAAYATLAAVAEVQFSTMQTLPFSKTTVGDVNLCPDGSMVRCRGTLHASRPTAHTLATTRNDAVLTRPSLHPAVPRAALRGLLHRPRQQ